MTVELVKILYEIYPPKDGLDKVNNISIYGAHERVYLTLLNRSFIDSKKISDINIFRPLAENIFDVPFYIGSRGDVKNAVFFEPNSPDKYSQNYSNHYIQINLPLTYLEMTISTGNRGRVDLFDKQRKKYVEFVNGVYDIFPCKIRK
jgi:hypothetical protein